MLNKEISLKNAFGGPVYISSAQSGAVGEVANSGAFVVTFGGLPREACVAIATNDWGSGYSSGLLGIGTGVTGSGNTQAPAQQNGWNMNLLISEAFADDPIEHACAVGVTSAAMTVAKAASGCACENENTCFVSLKYY